MTPQSATVLTINHHDDDAPDTRECVLAIIDAGEATQALICRESGLSSAILSTWLKGKYKGDNAAVDNALRTWMDARQRRSAMLASLPQAPPWLATPSAQKIASVLAYAQMAGDIGCVYGGAGMGKTVTLSAYADGNPNVWVVEMNAATAAVASSLEEIAEAIGLRGIPSRAARLHREIVRKLRGTGGLLVIDEAQHLRTNAIEAIRAIHDATGVGLVLCGNESVYARLTGGSREASFAQLFSRLGKRLRLVRPVKADVAAMAAHYRAEGKDEMALLMGISAKPGALRAVVKVLRLAGMMAAGKGEAVNVRYIKAAWRDLGGVA